jgi:hypothetical protein
MKPENKAFLDANRHHYETFKKAQYMRHLNAHEREGMQRVMREEFQPGYNSDLWCPPCVADMVVKLYERYDEWLSQQPVTVHANFPSNKPEQ